ncbi:hypothetical protein B0H13DRAFT_1873696 [Mycena leptocephala]|nr:hypothetical protein B0H13DRAFT_1873696 [Mycena leptocephala]
MAFAILPRLAGDSSSGPPSFRRLFDNAGPNYLAHSNSTHKLVLSRGAATCAPNLKAQIGSIRHRALTELQIGILKVPLSTLLSFNSYLGNFNLYRKEGGFGADCS